MQAFGGIDATVAKAREFFEQGDLRFAAELASHAVSPTRATEAARSCSPRSWSGWATVRSTRPGATATSPARSELRTGKIEHTEVSSAGLAPALTITQLFDSHRHPDQRPKAWNERLSVGWHFTDDHENYRMELSNGALIHYPTAGDQPADLTVTLTSPQLLAAAGRRETRRD